MSSGICNESCFFHHVTSCHESCTDEETMCFSTFSCTRKSCVLQFSFTCLLPNVPEFGALFFGPVLQVIDWAFRSCTSASCMFWWIHRHESCCESYDKVLMTTKLWSSDDAVVIRMTMLWYRWQCRDADDNLTMLWYEWQSCGSNHKLWCSTPLSPLNPYLNHEDNVVKPMTMTLLCCWRTCCKTRGRFPIHKLRL